jgi:signal transduction histidine kinase
MLSQRLKSTQKQVILEKMSSDFLIQQSNAAIVVLNTDYTIADANQAYLNIVNKSKKKVVGTPCYQTYYGLNAPCSVARPELPCPMLETLRTGKSAHVIHEFPKTVDQQTYGNIVTYPLKDQDGQILRIIEIWRDITEKINNGWNKRVAELKADLNKMVQEDRMISLGKLVASCVHEINNPLQGLLTFSHMMQEMFAKTRLSREDIQKGRDFMKIMSTELERCGKIVSGLLSFSRESPLEYKENDLNDILKSVISLTRHKIELHDVCLKIELSDSPMRITGDTNRLQQCLLNLIFNAVEAMPEGGNLYVKSRLDPNQQSCKITVKDTGCGITEEDLEHIYDPFFTTKPEGEGTGLGLSIVYGVVKNHRGRIAVKSKVGEGTTFSLHFPLS